MRDWVRVGGLDWAGAGLVAAWLGPGIQFGAGGGLWGRRGAGQARAERQAGVGRGLGWRPPAPN